MKNKPPPMGDMRMKMNEAEISKETNKTAAKADLPKPRFFTLAYMILSGSGSSIPSMVMVFITTGVTGRSFMPVSTAAISSTTSIPSMTLPKAA